MSGIRVYLKVQVGKWTYGCCSRARSDGAADSKAGSSLPFAGYLLSGQSVPLPGRSSPTGSSTSSQSAGVSISSAHSLSLPNLQQHCSDAASFINDAINSEWVSLMTSMNLGEGGDVDNSTESRSVQLTVVTTIYHYYLHHLLATWTFLWHFVT